MINLVAGNNLLLIGEIILAITPIRSILVCKLRDKPNGVNKMKCGLAIIEGL